jgi:predicted O-methyltransferase YrrM
MSTLPLGLVNLYKTGTITDKNGSERVVDSAISEAEAEMLARVVQELNARTTLETGVAFGASALAICFAKGKAGKKLHYGVDPNQSDFYGGAALALLENENLINEFKLLEGPSHMMLPMLIDEKIKIDFAFIDGWHTFDYTLIDFFLVDKLLRPGGMVAFHDMQGLSKQKVLRFILSHRRYCVEKKYRVKGNESFLRTIKFFVWRLLQKPRLLFSWFHWSYQLKNSSGLIVLRKIEEFEPNFDFFKNF